MVDQDMFHTFRHRRYLGTLPSIRRSPLRESVGEFLESTAAQKMPHPSLCYVSRPAASGGKYRGGGERRGTLSRCGQLLRMSYLDRQEVLPKCCSLNSQQTFTEKQTFLGPCARCSLSIILQIAAALYQQERMHVDTSQTVSFSSKMLRLLRLQARQILAST